MRVQTEEWRRFIPGVRMYKGKMTLFYNGEKLWDEENGEYLVYDEEQRESWEVIIVLPGVEVIPDLTFYCCWKVKTVIMSDSVRRVEQEAFYFCKRLSYVRLSRNLEYIGIGAFANCESLSSIFIPPSCREIGLGAFNHCTKLIIMSVPHHTHLYGNIIAETALIEASPFSTGNRSNYENYFEVSNSVEVPEWIKNQHHKMSNSLYIELAHRTTLQTK